MQVKDYQSGLGPNTHFGIKYNSAKSVKGWGGMDNESESERLGRYGQ